MKTTATFHSTRRAICSGLIAEAQRLATTAAHIRDVNRAYPGEAHDFGSAFAAIANAHMALNLAAALSHPVPHRAR